MKRDAVVNCISFFEVFNKNEWSQTLDSDFSWDKNTVYMCMLP